MSTTEGIDDGIGVSVLDGTVTDADGKDTTCLIWGVEQETQVTAMKHNRKVEILFTIALVLCDLSDYVLSRMVLLKTPNRDVIQKPSA